MLAIDRAATPGSWSLVHGGKLQPAKVSKIQDTAGLPGGAQRVDIGWDRKFGTLVLRQMDVENPYEAYIAAGTTSGSFPIEGGGQRTGWETFTGYIAVGFDHIIPKGLDHILFVLAVFFLSPNLRTLLWQVSGRSDLIPCAAASAITRPRSAI